MERGGLPLVNHLLQHTLRSLCAESQWIYSVFWRILPRNYPPPKWDTDAGPLDRSKGNKRNWILVWEDGFCDFAACSRSEAAQDSQVGKNRGGNSSSSNPAPEDHQDQIMNGITLQPELFFKMSHDVYNYGEGLMGKVAADNSHKWIYRDPPEHEIAFLSPWQGSLDPHPRTWEAQFKSGIQTIAVVAVGEGLLQLGSTKKIIEDLNFVILLQRKFNYLQSIPGVFAPHPMSELRMRRSSQGIREEAAPGGGEEEGGSCWSLKSMTDQVFRSSMAAATAGDEGGKKAIFASAASQEKQQQQQLLLGVKRPLDLDLDLDTNGLPASSSFKLPSTFAALQAGAGISSQFGNRLLSRSSAPPFPPSHSPSPPHLALLPSMSSLQALLSKLPSVTTSDSATSSSLFIPSPPPPCLNSAGSLLSFSDIPITSSSTHPTTTASTTDAATATATATAAAAVASSTPSAPISLSLRSPAILYAASCTTGVDNCTVDQRPSAGTSSATSTDCTDTRGTMGRQDGRRRSPEGQAETFGHLSDFGLSDHELEAGEAYTSLFSEIIS